MTWTVPNNISSKTLSSSIVLLDLTSRKYYVLNETGSFVWRAILEGKNPDAVIESMAEEYDCPLAQAKSDVNELLNFLMTEKLLVGTAKADEALMIENEKRDP